MVGEAAPNSLYRVSNVTWPRYFSPVGELDSGVLWLLVHPLFFELRWSKLAQRLVRTFCIVFDAIPFVQYAYLRHGGLHVDGYA